MQAIWKASLKKKKKNPGSVATSLKLLMKIIYFLVHFSVQIDSCKDA